MRRRAAGEVADLELASSRRKRGRRPPERFHVFVSYTTREDEVRVVKPIVDHFLKSVLGPVIDGALGEPPAFYDGYSLYRPAGPPLPRHRLERALRFAIEESEILVAFISPEYPGSEWCRFECTTMASKKLRPWFDLCRVPPIPELRDRRTEARRPSWWDCALARFLMWLWRLRREPRKPGGAILSVLWKGDEEPLREMAELREFQLFDWRSCAPAFEARERVRSHQVRHGSVSPQREWEALRLDQECLESMHATAVAIAEILRQRRKQYAS